VHLALSTEQQLLQETALRFIHDEYDFTARARFLEGATASSPTIWRRFAELGWLALPLPESYGGIGGTAFDLAVLMQALGRGLVAEPYLASVVLGGGLIAQLGRDDQKREILPKLAASDIKLAVAFSEPHASSPLTASSVIAQSEGNRVRLTGRKAVVLSAPSADLLVIKAQPAEEAGLSPGTTSSFYLVAPNAPGLELRSYRTIDGGCAADIILRDVQIPPDARLGDRVTSDEGLDRVIETATVAVCAEALGAVEGAVAMTREYLNTREQFGRPIGANQALRHRWVDMFIAQEEICSVVLFAARCLDLEDARRLKAVSAAKVMVGQRGRKVCEEAIQLHGGIAITDEYAVGHYLKRLIAIERILGDTDFHLDRFAGAV
jgi:alkylation response protein AidB-like acyl-CoA dehydrogenase